MLGVRDNVPGVRRVLKGCTHVCVNDKVFPMPALRMLCEALHEDADSVVSLDVAGNSMGHHGAVLLCDTMELNTTVEEINLACTLVGVVFLFF